MTKSALQIARAAYQPKVPAALKGAVKAVDGEYTQLPIRTKSKSYSRTRTECLSLLSKRATKRKNCRQ